MGIRIKSSETYRTTVKFDLLTSEGKKEEQSFEAEFKRLTQAQVREVMEECKNDAEMLPRVLVSWRMKDIDSGESIPFSDATLSDALAIPGFAGVTMLRFMETCGASRQKP